MHRQVMARGLEVLTIDDRKDAHAVKDDDGITSSTDRIQEDKSNAVKSSMPARLLVTAVALAAAPMACCDCA